MDLSNPLPGMNPWLEHYWDVFQPLLLARIGRELEERLPDGLQVHWKGQCLDSEDTQPDLKGLTGLQNPPAEKAIRIVHWTMKWVTVIELVSPSTKGSKEAQAAFSRRQQMALANGVNLVLIDLIRTEAGYFVNTLLPGDDQHCRSRLIELDHALPEIEIPLRSKDPAISLNLQEMVDDVFLSGRFSDSINYEIEPPLALNAAEQDWLKTSLNQRELASSSRKGHWIWNLLRMAQISNPGAILNAVRSGGETGIRLVPILIGIVGFVWVAIQFGILWGSLTVLLLLLLISTVPVLTGKRKCRRPDRGELFRGGRWFAGGLFFFTGAVSVGMVSSHSLVSLLDAFANLFSWIAGCLIVGASVIWYEACTMVVSSETDRDGP